MCSAGWLPESIELHIMQKKKISALLESLLTVSRQNLVEDPSKQ